MFRLTYQIAIVMVNQVIKQKTLCQEDIAASPRPFQVTLYALLSSVTLIALILSAFQGGIRSLSVEQRNALGIAVFSGAASSLLTLAFFACRRLRVEKRFGSLLKRFRVFGENRTLSIVLAALGATLAILPLVMSFATACLMPQWVSLVAILALSSGAQIGCTLAGVLLRKSQIEFRSLGLVTSIRAWPKSQLSVRLSPEGKAWLVVPNLGELTVASTDSSEWNWTLEEWMSVTNLENSKE